MKKTETLAKLALFLATIIWGSSFVIIKDALDLIVPNYLMALRFTGACIIFCVVFHKKLRSITPDMLWRGAVMGVCLFFAYFTQTLGAIEITPGKSAFLTAIYCILVPFMAWIMGSKRPDRWNVIAAFVCITGIGLISLKNDFTIGRGDVLTLIGGFFYSCHMVAIVKYGEDRDPVIMTILQFATAAVIFWIATFLFDGGIQPVTLKVVPSIAYLCLFCTGAALLLQNFGQKHTSPSAAALILTFESVFGTLFSIIMGREDLSFRIVSGFVLIFLAVVVSETKLSFLKKKKEEMLNGANYRD